MLRLRNLKLMVVLSCVALSGFIHTSFGAQLSVGPILLDLKAPSASGTLTLVNNEDYAVTVQTRVFLWRQGAVGETLEQTSDVVASPPSVTLQPHQEYTVRVVRTAKATVQGEESYRVVVDQLPDLRRQPANGVNLLIRQSIPVFFSSLESIRPDVDWSLQSDGDQVRLVAANSGDIRLRIANVRLVDASGNSISTKSADC